MKESVVEQDDNRLQKTGDEDCSWRSMASGEEAKADDCTHLAPTSHWTLIESTRCLPQLSQSAVAFSSLLRLLYLLASDRINAFFSSLFHSLIIKRMRCVAGGTIA